MFQLPGTLRIQHFALFLFKYDSKLNYISWYKPNVLESYQNLEYDQKSITTINQNSFTRTTIVMEPQWKVEP